MNTLYLTVPVYDEEDMRRPSCVRMFHCCSTLMLPTPRLHNVRNLISLTTYPCFPLLSELNWGKEIMAKTLWYCIYMTMAKTMCYCTCMTMAKTVSQRTHYLILVRLVQDDGVTLWHSSSLSLLTTRKWLWMWLDYRWWWYSSICWLINLSPMFVLP